MAIRRRAPKIRPWVEGVAGSIGDPVRRLRFLRAVAPIGGIGEERRRRRRTIAARALVAVLAVGAVLVTISFMRATARPVPAAAATRGPAAAAAVPTGRRASEVWRVEASGSSEVYSNGLRV